MQPEALAAIQAGASGVHVVANVTDDPHPLECFRVMIVCRHLNGDYAGTFNAADFHALERTYEGSTP